MALPFQVRTATSWSAGFDRGDGQERAPGLASTEERDKQGVGEHGKPATGRLARPKRWSVG